MIQLIGNFRVYLLLILLFIIVVILLNLQCEKSGSVFNSTCPLGILPPPIRTATAGVRIYGPKVPPLKCEIRIRDGTKAVDWTRLGQKALEANRDIDVTFKVSINTTSTKTRVECIKGCGSAGEATGYIQNCISTWHYTSCCNGEISYRFNVKGNFVNVDKMDLEVTVPVGVLWIINGLSKRRISFAPCPRK